MDAYELAKSISEDQEFIYGISPQRSRDIEMFLQKCREHLIKRKEFPIVDLPKPDENDPYAVYFIGDTAGDVFSTIQLYKRFSFMKDRLTEEAIERGYGQIGVKLVFLGNYSGRPPAKLSKGGIQNLLFLLSLKMVRPDEIFLLRGNEEARELYDFEPFYLRKELERIFGRTLSEELIYHLYRIYDELPLFARTPNGIISSHAGFPGVLKGGIKDLKRGDNNAIRSTVWGDPQESGTYRGEISIETNYNRYDFERFLEWSGSNLFIRAHDPRVKGYSMYIRRLLTVVSSSRYEEKGNGGIVVARALVHPDKEIKSVDDVRLRELEDFTLHEGRIPTWKA